ncbi:MAG: PD-(D/E)XK nuclease family protein, partial [Desulfobacterota bacterium]|nr:PD-(D/E)XK nuclease family protein [Thermodesulfobacteriota bacterium]
MCIRDRGYVEIKIYNRSEENPPEKKELQDLIKELKERGYNYSDVAILTQENEDVVNFSTWLNEIGVPFISYSNLDIRTRKLTREILSLLKFLDSPPDNLSFSTFLLGDIVRATLEQKGDALSQEKIYEFLFRNRKEQPLYKIFQQQFPEVWEKYFARLFRLTGYLPLYNLVSEIYCVFGVWENFKNEEATLIKILEVIKTFESHGTNNPADFFRLASDENLGEVRWNIDVPEGIEAVKLMTIHKAKGLEFPVVILILYGEQSRSFKYILTENEEEVNLLKVNRKIAEASEFLQNIYEEERAKEMVNRLNMLYVGFTRAESELYVIGVSRENNQFPINFLKKAKPVLGEKKPPQKRTGTAYFSHLALAYSIRPIEFFSSFSPAEGIKIEERKRGEFIHQLLSFIEYLNDEIESELEEQIRKIIQTTNIIDYPADTVKKEIMEFISQEEIRPYFTWKPGRIILREQDVTDPEGNLLRMDRVIIDENRVTVIDYKTGSEKIEDEKYFAQVKNYQKILQDLYPDKKVEGVIVYFDTREVIKIN